MVFSSYQFIFGFLPIVLLCFYLLRHKDMMIAAKVLLSVASFVFYGIGQPTYILIFIASVLLNYLIVLYLLRVSDATVRRILLCIAVLLNLGPLVYFKYTNFFIEILNSALSVNMQAIDVTLPVGISFFTFQMLMFAFTVYKDKDMCVSFLDYILFISFFPQLVVGPVVKGSELLPQLTNEKLRIFDTKDVCRGIMLFSVGCAKKILIADTMIDFSTNFYGEGLATAGVIDAWVAVLCYAFAYYFDFSGYIDMARGLGHLFGIHLPVNFDSPYKSQDFASFWRSWNITISRFFNEYVFNKIFRFGDSVTKMFLATIVTFMVSGLWHGAGWHFIVWGVVNGVLVCTANYRALKKCKPVPKALGVALTFFVAVLVRVLFDCTDLNQAILVYQRLFTFSEMASLASAAENIVLFISKNVVLCFTLVISSVITFCFPNSNSISNKDTFYLRDAIWCGFLLMTALLNMSEVSTFLYFKF